MSIWLQGGTGGGGSCGNDTPESWVASDWLEDKVAEDMNETGLADTVGQSDAKEVADTGESLLEVELASDMRGEYLRWSGGLHSIVLTRLALLDTTLAVLITGEERASAGVADTKPSSGALETAVEG